jgi:alcohol dehydrogenase (cytochrome c)
MRGRLRWVIAGLLGIGVLAGVGATTLFASSTSLAITPVPYLSGSVVTAYAGDNWVENGGDVENDRYSTLTQITPANVGTLTQAWATNLGLCPSGQASCGSEEATPVEYGGTLYYQTPRNGVYALDATTGQVLWNFNPPYATWDPGFQAGSGGRQPGVSVANGRVFVGFADGSLVALNPLTGQLIWRTVAGPWQQGIRLSAAPLYYNGVIYEPTSGGDGGSISTSVEAFNAEDGALLWSWGTVPQAGQPGANTWSNLDGGAYTGNLYGGGSTWQTPAIDAKDGLLIVGTGNPVPWNTRGPGDNLYTDSIVGLDLQSGQLAWYYQTVHHDLWDSDLPNNPIVYDTKYKGKKIVAVADVAKYGWTWELNAKTGKPIEKVDQVAVPQDNAPGVNTAKTQPIPQTPNTLFFPAMKNGDGRLCSTTAYWDEPMTTPDGHPLVFGCDFQPYDTTQWIVTPFENMDWPSSSYSPLTNGFITCGDNGREYGHEQIPAASETIRPAGGIGAGVLSLGGNIPATNTGNFSSLNLTTNKFEFHQKWSAICFSGSADTASGLTFVGHLGEGSGSTGQGYLEALNTKTGAPLWNSPIMTAEAASPPITYSVNGTQYVVEMAGGEGHEQPDPTGGYGSTIYAYALPAS